MGSAVNYSPETSLSAGLEFRVLNPDKFYSLCSMLLPLTAPVRDRGEAAALGNQPADRTSEVYVRVGTWPFAIGRSQKSALLLYFASFK
jgi:hypothetical protein